jgi:hypothetical protein
MSKEPEQISEPEEPHDVLAAEEFGVPAPDPLLQDEPPAPVPEDPDDPEGQAPPHDVLAGEEFPIPGGTGHNGAESEESERSSDHGSRVGSKAVAGVLGAVAVGFAAVLRLKRGRASGDETASDEPASDEPSSDEPSSEEPSPNEA